MINKEHNEEQLKEKKEIVDNVLDIFRNHKMTVDEMRGALEYIKNRIVNISILPNKENEPEHMTKLTKEKHFYYERF